jgi:two-component system, NtrC family, response regulator AtoC
MPHALAVDDDPNFLLALSELIQGQGFTADTSFTLRDARSQITHRAPDVVLVDLFLPDGSGIDLLKDLGQGTAATVVLMTGYADVETAVQALRLGASDYLTKPLDIGRLKEILAGVVWEEPAGQETAPVPKEYRASGLGLMLGASPAMLELYEMLDRVAPTDAPVFLIGESGTGKDLAAQTVHLLSRRSKSSFLPLNCGAISPTLIESELFGHEQGSFTGAERRHKGYFERAHQGTLFLDEITEMPVDLQVKLLRVLETGQVMRTGGDKLIDVDVRVVAATNRDPLRAVRDGKMREDLLYRLQVFPVDMPPLRDRIGDVELLAEHFLGQLNERHGTAKAWTAETLERLRSYSWPGNVRELKNVVHRAYIMADAEITPECLPRPGVGDASPSGQQSFPVGAPLAEVRGWLIEATLGAYGGDRRKAAAVLGVSPEALDSGFEDEPPEE